MTYSRADGMLSTIRSLVRRSSLTGCDVRGWPQRQRHLACDGTSTGDTQASSDKYLGNQHQQSAISRDCPTGLSVLPPANSASLDLKEVDVVAVGLGGTTAELSGVCSGVVTPGVEIAIGDPLGQFGEGEPTGLGLG